MPLDVHASMSDSRYATVLLMPSASSSGASSGRSGGKEEKEEGLYQAVVIASRDSIALGMIQWR